MRPDVKLGVTISLVFVLVAGGYYLYLDMQETPISLAGTHAASSDGATQDVRLRAEPRAAHKRGVTGKLARTPVRGTTTGTRKGSNAGSYRKGRNTTRVPRKHGAPSENVGAATAHPSAGGKTKTASRRDERSPGGAASRHANAGRTPASTKIKTTSLSQRHGRVKPAPSRATTPGSERRVASSRAGGAEPAVVPRKRGSKAGPGRTDVKAVPTSMKPTPRPSPVPRTQGEPGIAVETHRIQSGDTFASLAAVYYGDEKYTRYLIENNPQIDDPRRLRIGAEIRIPPAPPAEELRSRKTRAHDSATAGKEAKGRRTYRVKPGDSFYNIAQNLLKDSSRWKEVLALNRDLVDGDPKKLRVGQTVVLPNH